MLGIERPDGFYNADGSVNADVAAAAAAAGEGGDGNSGTGNAGDGAPSGESFRDALLRHYGADPSTWDQPSDATPGLDWRGEPIQSISL